mmetsp:Transcript_6737/g.18857  ORF Transcript_6737/g.18857 Transcript_6737/m.18857 type:complete len:222 (+) Transcript_6737:619-1284(+)
MGEVTGDVPYRAGRLTRRLMVRCSRRMVTSDQTVARPGASSLSSGSSSTVPRREICRSGSIASSSAPTVLGDGPLAEPANATRPPSSSCSSANRARMALTVASDSRSSLLSSTLRSGLCIRPTGPSTGRRMVLSGDRAPMGPAAARPSPPGRLRVREEASSTSASRPRASTAFTNSMMIISCEKDPPARRIRRSPCFTRSSTRVCSNTGKRRRALVAGTAA